MLLPIGRVKMVAAFGWIEHIALLHCVAREIDCSSSSATVSSTSPQSTGLSNAIGSPEVAAARGEQSGGARAVSDVLMEAVNVRAVRGSVLSFFEHTVAVPMVTRFDEHP